MKSPKNKTDRTKANESTVGYLRYKELPESEALKLIQAGTSDEVQDLVHRYLHLDRAECDKKQAVFLDFFTGIALFCRYVDMLPEELSVAFAVSKIVIDQLEAGSDKAEVVLKVKQLLENSSEPSGLDAIEPKKLQSFLEYIINTALQHHSLYRFALQEQPEQLIITQKLLTDALPEVSVPFPPPLCEGMPEDLHHRLLSRSGTSKTRTVIEETVQNQQAIEELKSTVESQQDAAEFAINLLSVEEVTAVVDSVCQEMLSSLQTEVAAKIKDREINWINKINKIHNTA